MLFNSYIFLFGFLPVVLAVWWALRRKNPRLAFLTGASWFFYAWWDWRFLPLMLLTTMIDYVAARLIEREQDERRRKLLLIASLGMNLALLAWFKYVGFFIGSFEGIGRALGVPVDLPALSILLPIGISFYTFNSMSYTIDVYRRELKPTRNLLEYTTFVALFPHLVAGPIVRYADLRPQLERPLRVLTSPAAGLGLFFLTCGLVKKLLLADQLDPHVDELFAQPENLGFVSAWAAAFGYSLQLYFDFSGYSDMAVGLALLLGFRFPQNFNSPFKAENIADFWRRWHMTLSSWIRDYLFIPLGGSRRGTARTTLNLLITMFLAGLWHGAAWTFVVWGLVHGTLLGVHGLLRNAGLTSPSVILNRTATFLLVVAAFVIFRSPDLHTAGLILSSRVGLGGAESAEQLRDLVSPEFVVTLVILLAFVHFAPNTWEFRVRPRLSYGVATGIACALAIMSIAAPHPFIYFQF